MARATLFEIQAEKPERAILFYEEVFGWKFTKWEASPVPYWFIETGPDKEPGINGGLVQRTGQPPLSGNPINAFTISMEVENIEETQTRGANGGGSIVVE